MEWSWLVLVLVSAVIHPVRDLLLKGLDDPLPAYVWVSITWAVMALGQALVLGQGLALPGAVWWLVLCSAVGLSFYYYGTLSALRRGNLSVYYPIVRSSPAVIAVVSVLLLDQQYSSGALAGIALIILGGLMIQKPRGAVVADGRALLLAMAAMLGSAAYTLSDAVAMRLVAPASLLFSIYILVTLSLLSALALERRRQAPLRRLAACWRAAPLRVLSAGVVSYISYLLILTAFQLGGEAAAVSATRQVSIPVSVLLAAWVLKETRIVSRLGWSALIAAGVILLVVA